MAKYYFLIFLLVLFGSFTKPAQALEVPELELTYENGQIEVPASLVASWQGSSAVSQLPSLFRDPYTAEDLLKNFAGLPVQLQNPVTYYNYDLAKIYDYVDSLSSSVETPVVDPKITIADSKVTDFVAPQDGLLLDRYHTTMDILSALDNQSTTTALSLGVEHPQQSLSALNNLGINTLIARGTSNFKGSPNNRRHNIAVGIEKEKGVLVAPGAEFSFNDNLGPVDGDHGFLPELVIKGHDTIPEFGGGLCQVSTTAFRAAMQAGVPITQRRNHAYAVSYYSPQGTDATIYPGSIDLKFVNDTPGYILIWPYEKDSNTLVFDFYGTQDDRQVTIDKPMQYDFQPGGAMKASWQREVVKAGQTRTDVFKSNYAPAAEFHHDTEFVPAASSTKPSIQAPKLN